MYVRTSVTWRQKTGLSNLLISLLEKLGVANMEVIMQNLTTHIASISCSTVTVMLSLYQSVKLPLCHGGACLQGFWGAYTPP